MFDDLTILDGIAEKAVNSACTFHSPQVAKLSQFFFTITAGRTGTAWLADFLQANLNITAVHEHLEIDDFGTNMPDIRTMRSFNERGFDAVCQEFWQRKAENMRVHERYAETNHTLAKCGLVEWAARSGGADDFTFFLLKRDKARQCLSYLVRSDFSNITLSWQWYLSNNYPNCIVNAQPFLGLGTLGKVLWYVCEMEGRQEYYRALFANQFRMMEVHLEDVVQREGAEKFLRSLGGEGVLQMPEPKNTGHSQGQEALQAKVEKVVAGLHFDAAALANTYIENGRRLSKVG